MSFGLLVESSFLGNFLKSIMQELLKIFWLLECIIFGLIVKSYPLIKKLMRRLIFKRGYWKEILSICFLHRMFCIFRSEEEFEYFCAKIHIIKNSIAKSTKFHNVICKEKIKMQIQNVEYHNAQVYVNIGVRIEEIPSFFDLIKNSFLHDLPRWYKNITLKNTLFFEFISLQDLKHKGTHHFLD